MGKLTVSLTLKLMHFCPMGSVPVFQMVIMITRPMVERTRAKVTLVDLLFAQSVEKQLWSVSFHVGLDALIQTLLVFTVVLTGLIHGLLPQLLQTVEHKENNNYRYF